MATGGQQLDASSGKRLFIPNITFWHANLSLLALLTLGDQVPELNDMFLHHHPNKAMAYI